MPTLTKSPKFPADQFKPEEITQMRNWLKDLSFSDVDDIDTFIDELTAQEVVNAVNKFWDGGIEDFKTTL